MRGVIVINGENILVYTITSVTQEHVSQDDQDDQDMTRTIIISAPADTVRIATILEIQTPADVGPRDDIHLELDLDNDSQDNGELN